MRVSVQLCGHCAYDFSAIINPMRRAYQQDLRGGRVFSDTETASLRSSLLSHEKSLRTLQLELDAHRKAVERLEELEAVLSHAISGERALLAPIRRLPVELLVDIFTTACIPLPGELAAIIYGLPRLWARIPFDEVYDIREGAAYAHHSLIVHRMQLIVARSADIPLASPVRYTGIDRSLMAKFTEFLLQYNHKWTDLRVSAPGVLRWRGIKRLSQLRRLEAPQQFLTVYDDPEAALFFAPNLRIAKLTNIRVHTLPSLAPLPWAQLTKLSTYMAADDGLRIVSRCSSLEHWYHRQPPPDYIRAPGPIQGTIVSSRLRSLEISRHASMRDTTGNGWQILDHLRAPQLAKLTMHQPRSGPTASTRLRAFLVASGCHLRELTITKSVPAEDLGCVVDLQALQSLETLELSARARHPMTDDIVAYLALPMMPQLRQLALDGVHQAAESALTEMLAERSREHPFEFSDNVAKMPVIF
ncbi:hypothetical protein EV122DRAFT_210185 [Schizophyllum commune]